MHQNKIWIILKDGLILFAISSALVITANFAFSGLKGKIPKDDPIVTVISQGEIKGFTEAVEESIKTNPTKAVQVTDEHGRTSLMRAAYANLSNEAELTKQNEIRTTMTLLLLDKGAIIDAQDKDGWTAMMWAAWSNLPKVVQTLIERGATVTHADRQGNTALMIAAGRGNAAIVQSLLDKGADRSTKNLAGKSALDLAIAGAIAYPDKKTAYQQIMAQLGGS